MSGSARMDFPDTATADEHVCVFDMDADACLICGRTAEEAAKLEAAQERRELAAVGGILAKVSPTAWKYSQELKAQVSSAVITLLRWYNSNDDEARDLAEKLANAVVARGNDGVFSFEQTQDTEDAFLESQELFVAPINVFIAA